MASTNQSPFYQKAEAKFLSAQNPEDKIKALEEMIRECPKHKSSENMLANLKTRYKKLKNQLEKSKKTGKFSKAGIKKLDMQAAIISFTGVGKSSLLSLLTNAHPKISNEKTKFTTITPELGILNYEGVQIQLVEIPAIESEYYDKGIVNTSDVSLILITELAQLDKIKKELEKSKGKQIVVFNKIDSLTEKEKRKISATLQSKKYNFVLISLKTKEGIEELKSKLFKSFGRIRVYTKQRGEKEKSKKPIVLNSNSLVKLVAKKVFGNSNRIIQTKIWGPSSKFPGQLVSLNHKLKDLDTVEFKVK